MRFHTLFELDSSEGTVQLHDKSDDGKLILHPQPNLCDPNDPLRWPKWKKSICFFSVCLFSFMANFGIGGLAPAFYPLSREFHKTMPETSALLIWPILVLGAFNFMWVPLANYLGKRPVFIVATLLLCMSYLWGAVAQTFESLLWSNIVSAFAGSASEALAASIVNDVFFLHQRANLMGWYMNAISGGNTIGPLICGFVVTGSTWRVQKWLAFALVAVNFLLVLFFVPETRYDRPNILNASEGSRASRSRETSGKSKLDLVDMEKIGSTTRANELTHPRQDSSAEVPKKTFKQDLSLWSGLPKDSNPLILFLRPLSLIVYPAVILAFLGFAVSLAWLVAINILNSFVLQAPPYNWTAEINGLINIPGLIGNLLGAWVGGWVVDRYSDWRSKKNGGVFQPETRLHLLIIPALIVPAGCLVWGYGVAQHMNWAALFFANGMVSVGLTAVPTMTMTYVSDSYLPVNADALTLVVGLKNVVAFGFLYGITPWVEKAGYINVFGTQAGVYVAIMLLAVPLIVWGEKIRHVTASWRVILY